MGARPYEPYFVVKFSAAIMGDKVKPKLLGVVIRLLPLEQMKVKERAETQTEFLFFMGGDGA